MKQCGFCNIKKVKKREHTFCSRECLYKSMIKRISLVCLTCKNEYKVYPYQKNIRKYCSLGCRQWGPIPKEKVRRGYGFWKNASEEDKFERMKYLYNKHVIKKEGCWGWGRVLLSNKYAPMNLGNKMVPGHRVSWIIHKGPIPQGLWVLHKCDNPPCTNPDHLFLGRAKDNTQDMIKKGRKISPRGKDKKNTKLNIEKAAEIKRLLKEGYSYKKLSMIFNVSQGTIQNISDGRTWKYV